MIEARPQESAVGIKPVCVWLIECRSQAAGTIAGRDRREGLLVTVTPLILFCCPPTFEGWRGGVKDDMRRRGEQDGL